MIHDSECGGEHDVSESTRGKDVLHPLLHLVLANVEAGREDSALVDAADQLNDDLARSVVVDDLELSDVSYDANEKGYKEEGGGGKWYEFSANLGC